jgi:hypothetical protein
MDGPFVIGFEEDIPSDSPHDVQGKGNVVRLMVYYQQQNFNTEIDCHRAWLQRK